MYSKFIFHVKSFLPYCVEIFVFTNCEMISMCLAYNVDVPNLTTNLASMLIPQKNGRTEQIIVHNLKRKHLYISTVNNTNMTRQT